MPAKVSVEIYLYSDFFITKLTKFRNLSIKKVPLTVLAAFGHHVWSLCLLYPRNLVATLNQCH